MVKETTIPRENIRQSSHVALGCVFGEYIPAIAVRKSGRRPTLSTKSAAEMETIKLRVVLPRVS